MRNSPLSSARTAACFPSEELHRAAQGWLLDSEIRLHSPATIALRKLVVGKLCWFLTEKKLTGCGTLELRQFLVYLNRAHTDASGRWGNAQQIKSVKPSTVATYHRILRTFFRWSVAEGLIEASPMEAVAAPIARPDQVQPFTSEQVTSLLAAARKSQHSRRDEAILMLLLDTGLRATELCTITMADLDLQGRRCTVLGKGGKKRTVSYGGTVAKVLWQYLREDPRDPNDPLFYSERGSEPLTRSGLLQLFERLGKAAGIESTRCSPHTLRHTFAVEFLRAGGNVFTLQQMLGHTSLGMTNRYVAVSQADIENQHRQFSPADRLRGKRR